MFMRGVDRGVDRGGGEITTNARISKKCRAYRNPMRKRKLPKTVKKAYTPHKENNLSLRKDLFGNKYIGICKIKIAVQAILSSVHKISAYVLLAKLLRLHLLLLHSQTHIKQPPHIY